MTSQVAQDLRAAADAIALNSDAYWKIAAYYEDREVDADAIDVIRALREAAEYVSGLARATADAAEAQS